MTELEIIQAVTVEELPTIYTKLFILFATYGSNVYERIHTLNKIFKRSVWISNV
jgi:hypothetical protein